MAGVDYKKLVKYLSHLSQSVSDSWPAVTLSMPEPTEPRLVSIRIGFVAGGDKLNKRVPKNMALQSESDSWSR